MPDGAVLRSAVGDRRHARKYHCSWYAPGASGGVNIDGGAAVDPETGMLYVGSQSGLSTTEVGKDPCSEHRYTQAPGPAREQLRQARRACAAAGLRATGARRWRGWRGAAAQVAPAAGGAWRRARRRSYKEASPGTSTIAGISILKPRELGGITAYNMNTGDKVWWIPNGGRHEPPTVNPSSPDAALFANVKLPMGSTGPRPAAGHQHAGRW